MEINLIKCHGSGNDFLLLDEERKGIALTDQDRRNLTLVLCDREKNIGADGILFISASEKAHAKMRVFNADGSEASMCGNGLRCAGRYICERDQQSSIKVETMKATLSVNLATSLFEGIPTYAVEISPILFQLDALPLNLPQEELILEKVPAWHTVLVFSAVAVPNPHLITTVDADTLNSDLQQTLAEGFNKENQWFDDGVNVSFVVNLGQDEIYVRTYERGVGFTNACGTAMSSSSLIEVIRGTSKSETPITVYNDGGLVQCVIYKENDQFHHIDLIGNATVTHYYDIDYPQFSSKDYTITNVFETTEQQQYEKMAAQAKEHVMSKKPNLLV
ncbi:diaminopimelate epimerase [Jeotgalibacillus soli]|uniref:Diaminopimelate epimerase n=1 Tax=Jeotgalibacillus soli TaxID=889306 RepID=A0A0C2VM54_9BACL|nr:diaminopimelate epimerase [Jeotgalibacillus soli]KIL45501.1 diaminopimelate epimerase [Jeotgalibacillus soli]